MFLTEEVKAELLKYLTITLEPITHSPPELLATYVITIINNKDKTKEELRVKCEKLLETFLFSSTKPFVSKFFELLEDVESPSFIDMLYAEMGIERKAKKDNKEPQQKFQRSHDSRNHSEEEEYSQKRESTPEDEPVNIIVTKKQRVSDHDSKSTNNSREREDENRNRDSRRDNKVSERKAEDTVLRPLKTLEKSSKEGRERYDPSLDPLDVRSQIGRSNNNPISTLQISNNKHNNPVSQGDGRIRQCYSFFNRGFCEKGSNCQYYHGEHMEMDLSELEQLRPISHQQPMVFTPLTGNNSAKASFGISSMPQDQKSKSGSHYFQQEKMNSNQYNPYQIIANNSQNPNNNLTANNPYIPPSVRTSKSNKEEKDLHIQLNNDNETENNFAPPENINEYKFNNKPVNTFPLSRVRVDTSFSTVICLLNVPHKDNSISKLDEHFNKFGPIVNIEVLQNEKKAKIKFSSHRDAHSALKSPEAVFGNRFIKVLWNEQVDSHVSLVNAEEKKLEEERKAEEEKKKEEQRKAEQKKAEERRAKLLADRLEAAKKKAAKPDPVAKSAITKKRTDLISAKKKLLDQMIETLKKPELPLEKKQQMLKEVAALKNTIKDDLTKLAQENATVTPVPVPTPKPTFVSPVKKDKPSAITAETEAEGNQDLNIIADELNNLTKKAEQLGVFNKPARGRGRSRGGFHASTVPPKRPSHFSIDRRPTAFKLTGMPAGNLDEPLLFAHFSKFGTVQSVKIVGNDAIVKMEVRYQAEKALLNGMVINQHKARGHWYVSEEVAPTDMAVETNDTTSNNSNNNFEPEIETGPENITIENAPETDSNETDIKTSSSLETTTQSHVDQKDDMEVI